MTRIKAQSRTVKANAADCETNSLYKSQDSDTEKRLSFSNSSNQGGPWTTWLNPKDRMRRKLLSSQKKSSEQGQKLLTTDGSINLTFRDEPDLAAAKEVSLQQIQHIVIGD